MGLFGMFPNKQQKLNEALSELWEGVIRGTDHSCEMLFDLLSDVWGEPPSVATRWHAHCEWFFFYAHLVDWFAFHKLGESKRNPVVDSGVELGLEPFVVRHWPTLDDDKREGMISDLIEALNFRNRLYLGADELFTNLAPTARAAVIPGFDDSLRDEPKAKASRLSNFIHVILGSEESVFGGSEMANDAASALGTDPRRRSWVRLCSVP